MAPHQTDLNIRKLLKNHLGLWKLCIGILIADAFMDLFQNNLEIIENK